ncbi:MAG: UDP-glucose 4-epimerase GalE [Candidatus Eisenbacteria bacterium]|nr:UDP-glucose 4-epimerase GalE [Candidatus Eisenbacteria bacterium]
MKILVTGGAGYIGSHTVKELVRAGHKPVVLDDLSEGHRPAVRGAPLHVFSLADRERLAALFEAERFEAVVHFAAHCYVGESMEDPLKYWRNNTANALNLLEATVAAGVRAFVFSSTCATYGEPERIPLTEDHPQNPVNVYGETKLAVERMLRSADRAYGLRYAALRYFNAAGADPEGELGEDHDPETHLIPLVLQVALGKRPEIRVFGDDYETPDGTCIRDYIHVVDLAQAHILALRHLAGGGGSLAVNVGTGRGYSVREVIECARGVSGHPIPAVVDQRRPGDPARLVAGNDMVRRLLGWAPRYPDLEDVVSSAWNWHRDHPDGYGI